MQNSSAFQYIPIDQIVESTTNPRQTFDKNRLEDLTSRSGKPRTAEHD